MSDINLNFSYEDGMSLMNVNKKIMELLAQKYSSTDDYTPGSNSNADSIMNSVINSIDNASKLVYALTLTIKEGADNKYFRTEYAIIEGSNNLNSIQMVMKSLIDKLRSVLPTDISYAQPATIQLFYDRFETFNKLFKQAKNDIPNSTKIGATGKAADRQTMLDFQSKLTECNVYVDEFELLVKDVKSNYNYTQNSSDQTSYNAETDTEVDVTKIDEDKLRTMKAEKKEKPKTKGGSYLYYIDKLR